jgi:hypothetical protein
MLILSGVIAFLDGILLANVLSMFRLSVEAGTFLVVDMGRRIYPNLTVASAGCRSGDCDRSLGTRYRGSSWSRRHLSSGPMSMRLFRRRRRRRARTRRSVLRKA